MTGGHLISMKSPASRSARLLAAVLLLAGFLVPREITAGGNTWVQKVGHQLYLDGKPFYFLGADAYWLIDYALQDRGSVDAFFDKCVSYGLKVVRTWAFNHELPQYWGIYNQAQFEALDYVISSAGKHGVHLILSLGNFWEGYRSPKDFMLMAGADPTKYDVLEGFYGNATVRRCYRDHMWNMVTRNNTENQLAYRNDPTIMMWDVMNEPRCPGCTTPEQQAVHDSWIGNMTYDLKSWVEPAQFVAAGTEGFFMNNGTEWNPGSGTQCEGEDWEGTSQLAGVDVATVHVYQRQNEDYPADPPDGPWVPCDWACYCNYFIQYISLHERLAAKWGKPLVMEEFNIILPVVTEQQRTAFFALVYDHLLYSQNTSGPLMGVMFWNAAWGNMYDDGYNIYIDELPKPPAPSTPLGAGGRHRAPPPAEAAGASAAADEDSPPPPPPSQNRSPIVPNLETLDTFRRSAQRAACAVAAAPTWVPVWNNSWARTVNLSHYQDRANGQTVNSMILWAAGLLYRDD